MERDSQTLRDLALALSEDERKHLRQRIATSLSLRERDAEGELAAGTSHRSRDEVMRDEIPRLSFWQRLRYFLRRLFSTRSDDHAYVEFRIAEVRRRAIATMPSLRPMEAHSVDASVAGEIWKLYKSAYPIIPMFLDLWRSGGYMQRVIEHLLDRRIPDSKRTLYEFASLEELQEVFHRTERKGDVREHVVRRIDEYVESVPAKLLSELRLGLRPFYYLKQVATYSFNGLFEVFGFDPGVIPPEELPPFKDAPTSAALPLLELLYLALFTSTKLDEDFLVHDEVLERYLALRADEPDEHHKSLSGEDLSHEVKRFETHLRHLHDACFYTLRSVPLADLIRYYRRDPWMRIRPYVPAIKLEEFYRSSLMISVLSELDKSFPDVLKGVVERLRNELFKGEPPSMTYFRAGADLLAGGKHGPRNYAHIQSLTLAFNFFRFIYHGRMQETYRILTRVLPVRQRDSSSDLVTHLSGLEEVYADLEDFDHSFSTESQDGKAYFRVRYGVETDNTLARSYRSQVTQRDRESATLVDRTLEHVRGLAGVTNNLIAGLTDQIRERYASNDTRVNNLDGLDRLLESHEGRLRLFEHLMGHVRAMESTKS